MANSKLSIIQEVMTVVRKEQITPHYIRIFLTGPNIARFSNTTVGVNNKILIPPRGLQEIHFPTFDSEKEVWIQPAENLRPAIRTYTHRGIDLEKKEMWIDFAVHGDEGPASAWALSATEGDVLGLLMKDGKTELYAAADNYLLVGDATAIPVLAAILEHLPATASGICSIEVATAEDVQQLQTNADMTFKWLFNPNPQEGSTLADLVKTYDLPLENRFAYVAAEYNTVKALRSYLRQEKNWTKEELYAYSYWKSGVAEDRSTNERQQEKQSAD